jgi:hypothetical protein
VRRSQANVPSLQCAVWSSPTALHQSIAETMIERDLPFVDPRPRSEVGAVAMPLLRLCILQLELSLMVLDTSGVQQLTVEAAKNLEVGTCLSVYRRYPGTYLPTRTRATK